jgi:hypothetical protein
MIILLIVNIASTSDTFVIITITLCIINLMSRLSSCSHFSLVSSSGKAFPQCHHFALEILG